METKFEVARTQLNQNCIEKLDLSEKKININQAYDLGESIKKNTSLLTLNLSNTKLEIESIKSIANALEENNTLTTLNLSHNKIEVGGAAFIANALKKNQNLKALYLWNNEIGNEGAKVLINALEINSSLIELNLASNKIGEEGITGIANALIKNTSLIKLSLASNKISDEGATQLARLLEVNRSLKTLMVEYNQISEKGALQIIRVLEINTNLRKLSLMGVLTSDGIAKNLSNDLVSTLVSALVSALENNYTLLEWETIDTGAAQKIKPYLERNKQIDACLNPLNEAVEKGLFLNDQTIATCMKTLQNLIPNLMDLPKDSYPREACRLLSALEKANARYNEWQEALKILTTPFKNHDFQLLSNKISKQLTDKILSLFMKKNEDQKQGVESTTTPSTTQDNTVSNQSQNHEKDPIESILETILVFCDKPEHQKLEDLAKMKAIINSDTLAQEKLQQLQEIARRQKSYLQVIGFFNQVIGKSSNLEDFYQKLATLDPKDENAIEIFKNSFQDTKLGQAQII